jgi:hypothetical protein
MIKFKQSSKLTILNSLVFLVILLLPHKVFSKNPWSDSLGARGLALGGAVIAYGTGSDALSGNPATMGLRKNYIFENYYQYNPLSNGHLMQSALVDSYKNPRLAMGVYGTWEQSEPELYYQGANITRAEKYKKSGLALSILLSKNLSIGFNGYYFEWERDHSSGKKGFSGDFGILAKIGDFFTAGFVVYDLISKHDDDYPYSFGGGIALILLNKKLLLEADIVFEGEEPWVKGGIEFFFGKSISFRFGGGERRFTESRYFSGGIGYITKKSQVDIGIKKELTGGNGTIIGIGLRFYMR